MLQYISQKFSLSYNLVYGIIILVFIVWMIIAVQRRSNARGCMSFVYLGLLVFSIVSLFFAALFVFVNTVKDTYTGMMYGEHYIVNVVDFESYQSYDSENDRYRTMYTPIVKLCR